VLEEGSLTAHVTIVARAMGVPVLGRARDIRHIVAEGDLLLLDATIIVLIAASGGGNGRRRSPPNSPFHRNAALSFVARYAINPR